MANERLETLAIYKRGLKVANDSSKGIIDIAVSAFGEDLDSEWTAPRSQYMGYFMALTPGWMKANEWDYRVNEFLIGKAVRFGERGDDFPREQALEMARKYEASWDGETGDEKLLFEFYNLFKVEEMRSIGI